MANATVTITPFAYPKGYDNTQRMEIVRGTFAISNGAYPNGGLPLNWTGLEGLKVLMPGVPVDVDVHSTAYIANGTGNGPSGYIYLWDSVNGNLHIFLTSVNGASGASGPLIEYGGATIPNLVTTDVIQFEATFVRS